LDIAHVLQGVSDKWPAYRRLLVETDMQPDRVCFVGDDLPDLPIVRNCGLAVAVADACGEIKADAHYVTRAPGGRGAVREAIELILHAQDKWQEFVDRLRQERS
jgi:YrbI family 3-deoxy-D-manno-octulosonate 8-phosphate phosphatase